MLKIFPFKKKSDDYQSQNICFAEHFPNLMEFESDCTGIINKILVKTRLVTINVGPESCCQLVINDQLENKY